MEIGHKIRKVRELKNLTQEHVAQRLNISQSTYSRYEKEDGELTVALLRSISQVLEVTLEDLMSFDEKFIFQNKGDAFAYTNNKTLSVYYHTVSDKERELYEKNIKLLEDKINYLESKTR